MTFTIVFLTVIIALIVSKAKTIALRNNLNTKNENRLIITCGLIILFIITNATLPYPQSLYWFIALGVVFVGSILSFEIIKYEYKRFKTLKMRHKAQNVLFYSLLVIVTNIYI
jgi:hypothetical protein